ncbi:NAD-dependent epimerase/dehydratase family protein [Nocardia acidivorans]|uniref:NAD-dependent epimerase/dehydratase family protein n=1 Tax=Nocardia acidivorans TaxID=404580 RepID=UPI0008359822|nr:NAD-dependent epimerase/dehydratase family protein [Nocardia acidivorans]
MSLHVVAGAGGTGSRTALELAEAGERVRLVSRRGLGPEHPRIELAVGDTTDADRMSELATGAVSLINTTWPAYDRWPAEFPPIGAALLTAAERTGAGYVSLSNTYGYGRVDGAFTEDLPMAPIAVKGAVRAKMWLDALTAHQAGRARVAEVRAAAFLGRDAATSVYNMFVVPKLLAGEPVSYPGDLDVAKSWSYVGDVARTLAAVARSEVGWGRAWHVPSHRISVRELTVELAAAAAMPAPEFVPMTRTELAWAGSENSVIAEMIEMYYAFEHPDVLDATATERAFGLAATPLDAIIAETVTLVAAA